MEMSNQEIKKVEKQIYDVDVKVSSILYLLRGNDLDTQDRGLIGDIKEHERRLTRLEMMRDRSIWFFIGMAIPAGWGLVDIVQNLILKR